MPGVPNRDKTELRALIQERVHEFTVLRREDDIRNGVEPDEAQVEIEEYDPVVQLALVAVDRRVKLEHRIKCNAEVAQYVRPKLKTVEHSVDPDTIESLAEREVLSSQLIGLLDAAAAAKKNRSQPLSPAPPAEDPPA